MTAAQAHRPAFAGRPAAGIGIVRLPMPHASFLPDGCCAHACLHSPHTDPSPSARSFADPDDIARYRWWLGHQATFCVWRLLSAALTVLAQATRPSAEAVAAAARMYDACSVLLLYAGSCSPEVYGRTIRSAMACADPAFSGRWARDYEDIPGLMQAVRRAQPAALLSDLLIACKVNYAVHVAVAKYLVPDGPSLLRLSGRDSNEVTDRERNVLDAFFLVERVEVCRQAFTATLVGLCTLVLIDLVERPLSDACLMPGTSGAGMDMVAGFQRDAGAILRRFLTVAPDLRPCGRPDVAS
jgi:hypothetical protein